MKKKSKGYSRLVVDDATYKTQLNKMHTNRKPYSPIDPKMVRSFMPGNIQEVFVAEGDAVEEGSRLCILEAMKMKNVIIAPDNGTVKKINVKVGDKVPKHFILVELE
ncbi:MAG: acetyl-CoA carboxylase biotin carboxyl carrier protein subunit [Bacteroidales bacterium]